MTKITAVDEIDSKIYFIRGHKIMMDFDLAGLYGVLTKALNQAVKRNKERFPDDFMFQLTDHEYYFLKSQIVTSSLKPPFAASRWGGRRNLPYAFTEQGVAMLSSVLKSKKAIQVNIAIMRAFVRIKHYLATHKELAEKINKLEEKYDKHDEEIQIIFNTIKKMLALPEKPKKRIGFVV